MRLSDREHQTRSNQPRESTVAPPRYTASSFSAIACTALSTLGALCIANAALSEDRKALFNKLMIWGLSMSVIGAFVCWVFFGLL